VCTGSLGGWQPLLLYDQEGIELGNGGTTLTHVQNVSCEDLLRGACVEQGQGARGNTYRSIASQSAYDFAPMRAALDCNHGYCEVGDGGSILCGQAQPFCFIENDSARAGDCDLLPHGMRRIISDDSAVGRCSDANDDGVLDGGGSSISTCICGKDGRWASDPSLHRFAWAAVGASEALPAWSHPAMIPGVFGWTENGGASGQNRLWVPEGESWLLRQLTVTLLEATTASCRYRLVAGAAGRNPHDAGVEVAASELSTGVAQGVHRVGDQASSPFFGHPLEAGEWLAVEVDHVQGASCTDQRAQLSILYEAH
jgi:hypothetical protein